MAGVGGGGDGWSGGGGGSGVSQERGVGEEGLGGCLREICGGGGGAARPLYYAAPIGALFVLKFVRSRGISSTASKVRSDRRLLFKHKMGPLIAVNGR